jgi:anaerobic dimethyl sulfoxide reductase subunit B (iron-sulfur subunit)
VRWRNQQGHEAMGENNKPVFYNLSMSCNHCKEPACITACPVDAITKDNMGRVIINRKKCQGYRICITACPFAAPDVAEDRQEPLKRETWAINHPAQKCTYCFERVNDGQAPVCVGSCVAHALDYGDIEDLERKYPDAVRVNQKDFPYAYVKGNNTETFPSFLIRKRRPMEVV